ncbi:hypothetical protein [Paenibacillus sp. MSJ-34]|uniref:phage tail assembly chaperone n=1 Tax=Paenibacillus sp. MSJ-34 TaxID=2841529 RepID=UPI001C11ED9A|nr:hypothetical protein [Paenibacillus sp. MSJ-34]MBU5441207.1 hypothetical protein [Paenibacillus sp. MSJ-34]
MSTMEHMTEDQILDSLLEATMNLPEATVFIKRLNMRITLRGLTSNVLDGIRERCTTRRQVSGRIEEKLDNELFNATLISTATRKLEIQSLTLSGWDDGRITSRLQLSDGAQAIRRMLLAGEIDAIGDKILDLSGYGVSIEDVKN